MPWSTPTTPTYADVGHAEPSRAPTPASTCPGTKHRPAITDVLANGRAVCPVCGREVGLSTGPQFGSDGRPGVLMPHGRRRRLDAPEGVSREDALVMLRMAAAAYNDVAGPYQRACEGRTLAAYRAALAGISDMEIAQVYGVDRSVVTKLRRRVELEKVREKEREAGANTREELGLRP